MISKNKVKMTSESRVKIVISNQPNLSSVDAQAIKSARLAKRINNQKWHMMRMQIVQLKPRLKRAKNRRKNKRMPKLNPLLDSSRHLCYDVEELHEEVADNELELVRQNGWLYQRKLTLMLLLARPHLPMSKVHQQKKRAMMTLEPCF
jgi:hypothetical protein